MRVTKFMRLPLAGVALAALCVASPGQTTIAVGAVPAASTLSGNAVASEDANGVERSFAGHSGGTQPISVSADAYEGEAHTADVARERQRMREMRGTVRFGSPVPKGTIIVDTEGGALYRATGDGTATRYGIGVGRAGFTWSGIERVSEMAVWPDWSPSSMVRERHPSLPEVVPGGPENPLGARALRLGSTIHRIHGMAIDGEMDDPAPVGSIRMLNDDITELFEKVRLGTEVIVLGPGSDRTGILSAVSAL